MTDLPQNNIILDLDTVERPAEDVVAPFVVTVKGRVITMTDPEEFDWQDLLTIQTPQDFLRYCTTAEDREFLRDLKMPGWKFGQLMKAYQKHYKIDQKLEDYDREQARTRI